MEYSARFAYNFFLPSISSEFELYEFQLHLFPSKIDFFFSLYLCAFWLLQLYVRWTQIYDIINICCVLLFRCFFIINFCFCFESLMFLSFIKRSIVRKVSFVFISVADCIIPERIFEHITCDIVVKIYTYIYMKNSSMPVNDTSCMTYNTC